MGRIFPDTSKGTRIEHYVPLSQSKELALEYNNYLGVCYGGEGMADNEKYVLCCDAARGEGKLIINPWDKRQMKAIAYRKNGFIFVDKNVGLSADLVNDMQDDINKILQLNGELDTDGKMKYDTNTRLVSNRKRVFDSVSSQFSRWDKQGKMSSEFLKEKVAELEKQLENEEQAEPFIGVRLFRYRKKCLELEHRRM